MGLEQIGTIIDYYEHPCSAPWSLWFHFAGPAAIKMIWSIVDPDWKQLVKHATGESWLCGLKRIMRDGEETLPGTLSRFGEGVFKVAEVADYAAWVYFLASVGVEGYTDWSTMVRRANGCIPGSYWCDLDLETPIISPPGRNGTTWFFDTGQEGFARNYGIEVPANYQAQVSFVVDCNTWSLSTEPVTGLSWELYDPTYGDTWYQSDTYSDDGILPMAMVHSMKNAKAGGLGQRWAVRETHSTGYLELKSGTMSALITAPP
jgi:hypothetical protein